MLPLLRWVVRVWDVVGEGDLKILVEPVDEVRVGG